MAVMQQGPEGCSLMSKGSMCPPCPLSSCSTRANGKGARVVFLQTVLHPPSLQHSCPSTAPVVSGLNVLALLLRWATLDTLVPGLLAPPSRSGPGVVVVSFCPQTLVPLPLVSSSITILPSLFPSLTSLGGLPGHAPFGASHPRREGGADAARVAGPCTDPGPCVYFTLWPRVLVSSPRSRLPGCS